MSTLAFLNQLVGSQVLGDHLTAWVNHLVDNEEFARADAYRCITDWADEGDPSIIASTGQTWVRRDDVDPADAPVRRLHVVERADDGVFLIYYPHDIDTGFDVDDHGDQSLLLEPDRDLNRYQLAHHLPPSHDLPRGADFPVELLHLYRLEAWFPPEFFLPGCTPKEANTP
ncbi:hypothetical protein JK359_33435 [Streptomyces actinomycinicus]|uniref:Uncharacterized protein n=1 Tax=Streptomyces actinomycinicus TaxID=1695166 RepID=A0A937ERK0_9ACTN|nr:hypothetical protein [Streptomyces actinomycinicus]MBL1086810.1 hypothetical protein [Streptomyces actinomycinicus]